MENYQIILRPVGGEKSFAGVPNKRYTFVVHPSATKPQIRKAVEELFKVKVEKVNTLNCRGKLKRQGRTSGYTAAYKKAIVQLSKDSKSIEFFDSLV